MNDTDKPADHPKPPAGSIDTDADRPAPSEPRRPWPKLKASGPLSSLALVKP